MAAVAKPKPKWHNPAGDTLRAQISSLSIEADAFLAEAAKLPEGPIQDKLLDRVEKIQADQQVFLATLGRITAKDAVRAERAVDRVALRASLTRLVPPRENSFT